MNRKFIAGASLLWSAGMASAQVNGPLEQGFYLRGGLEAEHLSYDGNETTGGYIDFTLGIATGAVFGLPLGVELGAEGFSDDGTQSAFYGAALIDTGLGTIGVGVPRFALDKYVKTPQIGGFRLVEVLDLGLIDGQGVSSFHHLISSDVPYGLSYDYVGQTFAAGLTYHEFDDDETTVAQAVLRWKPGNLEMTAGGELFQQDELESKFAVLSAEWQSDRIDIGAAYSRLEPEVDFFEFLDRNLSELLADFGINDLTLSGNVDTTKAWATWRPLGDRLNLTASYLTISGLDADIYGLSARYNFAGAFVEAGAVDGVGSDTLLQASVGFDF